MKIQLTAREMLFSDCWDNFCQIYGIDPYAINDGLLDPDTTFSFTLEEANQIGIKIAKQD